MSEIPEQLRAALADRYDIMRQVGAGGMAAVYLANDLRHARKVAIKVLRPELAAVVGAERFIQEIRTTASLSHPNILPLFDSGEAAGFLYYVMPFIEGDTIRDKLNRERQFGIEEAVRIADEVADALDYAHRQGVVHRDIKPENILLHDGRPMVADFGIALAVSAAAGGRLTQSGLSVGTPQYMSPEQATADRDITARSDIYSLASVLYEMLTGSPPHTGSTAQQIITRLVSETAPPVTALRSNVPENVAAALRKALEKLPADRFTSARHFAEALGDANYRSEVRRAAGSEFARRVPLIALAGWGVALLVAAVSWLMRVSSAATQSSILAVPPPSGQQFVDKGSLALSRDGSRLVFAATSSDGVTQIWLRRIDAFEAVALPNTVEGGWPFWSHDGESIGFFARGRLWSLDLRASAPTDLCAAPVPGGGTWSAAGDIVFSSAGELWRAAASGGSCERLYADSTGGEYFVPDFLPDGRHFLFTQFGGTSTFHATVLGTLGRDSLRTLTIDGRNPRFAEPDRVFMEVAGSSSPINQLVERSIDLKTFALAPKVEVVASQVLASSGIASYSVSSSGMLAYLTGHSNRPPLELDRSGELVDSLRDTPLGVWSWGVGREHEWLYLASEQRGLYAYDWRVGAGVEPLNVRGVLPVSGPGDSLVAFLDWHAERSGCALAVLHVNDARVDTLRDGRPCMYPTSWSSDGAELLLSDAILWLNPDEDGAVWSFSIADRRLQPLVREAGIRVGHAVHSPDGKWVAFDSDRAGGRSEVYVIPRTGSARPIPISTGGGAWPRWRADGRELYFISADGVVYASAFPVSGPPRRLFALRGWTGFGFADAVGTMLDVSPDGNRFFVRREAVEPRHLVVVQGGGQAGRR